MVHIDSVRLSFRTLGEEDVSAKYVAWLNDPVINQFLETRFVEQTEESCRRFVLEMEQDPTSHLFGIYDKQTEAHIGNIKLGFIKRNHQTGELSFFIGEKHLWGRGLATESVARIVKWGFDEIGLQRIEAGCYETNLASLRTMLKSGFSVEGFFRKSVVSDGRRIGVFKLGILQDELA